MKITFFRPYLSEVAPNNKQPIANPTENILPVAADCASETLKDLKIVQLKGLLHIS